tara:strand:+ start:4705 stop:4920 length:216 start_codon:yes stop_codon:yes gene_type:complete
MGIKEKLTTQGSNLSQYDGNTPPQSLSSLQTSVLHNEFSINGSPGLPNYPSPSNLDMDGVTPPKYLDNPPV